MYIVRKETENQASKYLLKLDRVAGKLEIYRKADNMNFITYILIFLSKIIENALATLRLIVVASGKKILGAILQFCIALVWILVTGVVITKDPLKIVFFAFGSLVGSYIGSLIEEKLAMGYNLITCITDNNDNMLYKTFERKGYNISKIRGEKNNQEKDILLITVSRKKKHHVLSIIKEFDKDATIISEMAKVSDN